MNLDDVAIYDPSEPRPVFECGTVNFISPRPTGTECRGGASESQIIRRALTVSCRPNLRFGSKAEIDQILECIRSQSQESASRKTISSFRCFRLLGSRCRASATLCCPSRRRNIDALDRGNQPAVIPALRHHCHEAGPLGTRAAIRVSVLIDLPPPLYKRHIGSQEPQCDV